MQMPSLVEQAITSLQSIGLLYDVFGVLILGIPIMFRTSNRIREQAGAYWDLSRPAAKALASQTWDTFIGSLLLLAGFTFQLAGTLGLDVPAFIGDALVCVLFLLVTIYWLWLRRFHVESLTNQAQAKWKKDHPDDA